MHSHHSVPEEIYLMGGGKVPNCKVQEKKVDPNWVHVCTSLHGGMLWPLDDSFSMQKLTCLIRRDDKS